LRGLPQGVVSGHLPRASGRRPGPARECSHQARTSRQMKVPVTRPVRQHVSRSRASPGRALHRPRGGA
jgi:hypothetical protein